MRSVHNLYEGAGVKGHKSGPPQPTRSSPRSNDYVWLFPRRNTRAEKCVLAIRSERPIWSDDVHSMPAALALRRIISPYIPYRTRIALGLLLP